MAMHVIENEYLKVMVADAGAELSSVYDKEIGKERLWTADPAVWNRHAPILFPFVGRVVDGVYRIGDKAYSMKTQHGFARDKEFEFVEATEEKIVHRLKATEETKEIYPYDFELLVTHSLDQENPRLLHVDWEVKNNGQELMYYFIGGHPGFLVSEGEKKEDYYLEFPERDDLKYIGVNPATGFAVPDKEYALDTEHGLIKYNETVPDTWIFDYQNIKTVRIARPDKTPWITMDCSQFPLLAVWANPKGSFICLEPWVGRADNDGFTGTIDEKIAAAKLQPGDKDLISHTIEFHK